MKKLVYILFASLMCFVLSCQKNEQKSYTIGFDVNGASNDNGVVLVNLKTNYVGSNAITIPIKFGGDAVKGVDYNVSTDNFIIGGSNPVLTVKVTPLTFGTNKKLNLSFDLPKSTASYRFSPKGLSNVVIGVGDYLGYVSFNSAKAFLSGTQKIAMTMFNSNALEQKVKERTVVPVEVNTDLSTAVLGEDFAFEGEQEVVFDPGSYVGYVTLKVLKSDPNKNKIVLRLKENNQFGASTNPSITITILGSEISSLSGTWKVSKLYTTKASELDNWGGEGTTGSMEGYPELNTEDSFTVSLEDGGKFLPNFKSSLKNYFIGESKISFLETNFSSFNFFRKIQMQKYELSNVNRYFSSTEQSENKSAQIGFLIRETEGYQELVMFIIDYNSKTFFTSSDMQGMYGSESPTAMYIPIIVGFTKVSQ